MKEMGKAQIDKKTVVLLIAVVVILGLVITTPGWKDIFGLGGVEMNDQLLLYGAIGAGLIGMVVFVMNAK
jgi:hypothetical protein